MTGRGPRRLARDAHRPQPGRHRLPADAGRLLDSYRELYDGTEGRVSPLVGRTLESLGYHAGTGCSPGRARLRPPLGGCDGLGREYLETARPVLLDVGAAGKGYLVDLISDLLVELGSGTHVVDASGDLRVRGDASERIALEHPPTRRRRSSRRAPRGCTLRERLQPAQLGRRPPPRDRRGDRHPDRRGDRDLGPRARRLARRRARHRTLLRPGREPFRERRLFYVRMFANGRVEQSPSFPGEVFA